MTYGMRGAFTHNWNAYWNTALYGAYGAVRYNAATKALICGSPGIAALGLTGTCNSGFKHRSARPDHPLGYRSESDPLGSLSTGQRDW